MKFAVIAPAAHLGEFCSERGSVHLVLSQWVKQSPIYAAHYKSRSEAGDYVILDNCAHESGSGDSVDELMAMIELINPREVVLPDRLFFGEDTVETSTEACQVLKHHYPTLNLMAVPQGRTFQEWYQCLCELTQLPVNTIGISKDYEVWPGSLFHLVDQVPKLLEIHMLGWPRRLQIHEELEVQRPGRIRSTDSAKPLVYAMNETSLFRLPQEKEIAPSYPRRQGNPLWWNLSEGQLGIARNNVATFKESIMTRKERYDFYTNPVYGMPKQNTRQIGGVLPS